MSVAIVRYSAVMIATHVLLEENLNIYYIDDFVTLLNIVNTFIGTPIAL